MPEVMSVEKGGIHDCHNYSEETLKMWDEEERDLKEKEDKLKKHFTEQSEKWSREEKIQNIVDEYSHEYQEECEKLSGAEFMDTDTPWYIVEIKLKAYFPDNQERQNVLKEIRVQLGLI